MSLRMWTLFFNMHWCFASSFRHLHCHFSSPYFFLPYGQNISSFPVDSFILKNWSPLTSYTLPLMMKSG